MNALPITCKDAKTTFLLARRAERLARPLVEQVGDAWRLSITVTLGDKEFAEPWHVGIHAHYDRNAAKIPAEPTMPVHDWCIVTSEQLERTIEKMRQLAAAQVLATTAAAAAEADAEAAEIQAELEAGGEDADA
ncbi:hypothetical protein [Glutamicibacter nicotianae]|uniref:hypothetical protein n=1 Tax=Glutamicibacter nicotianae TaxID=37929 RepID=UPI0025552B0F|nr:hypothetical protein [Glutamicibacter nicotianae]WIV44506.1 hypothetical protein QQS42_02480 [Glutamicibacter nicotianae]